MKIYLTRILLFSLFFEGFSFNVKYLMCCEEHCFILGLYFLPVLIKSKLGNNIRLIGIPRQLLYPRLLSVSTMPLSSSLEVVPRLLLLFRVYQFKCLEKHWKNTRRTFTKFRLEIVLEFGFIWFYAGFGLIYDAIKFSPHSLHVVFHDIDFVIIWVVLR